MMAGRTLIVTGATGLVGSKILEMRRGAPRIEPCIEIVQSDWVVHDDRTTVRCTVSRSQPRCRAG